jgi:hypothetical protein
MLSYSLPRRGAFRRVIAGAFAAGAVALGACGGSDNAPQGPELPGNPGTPALLRAAFIIDVDTRDGRMKITPPELTGVNPAVARLGGLTDPGGQSFSLLSRDVINLRARNFFASPVGAIQANKVRVFFDLEVENKLSTVRLITPTFPDPPAGQSGLLLFPYSATAVTAAGGASVADENVVVITLPQGGTVTPNIDWNGGATLDRPSFPFPPGPGGNPHSFFNDVSCTAVPDPQAPSDCFRYETFGVLQPAVLSGARRIGFDMDASVGQFRVFVLAAADLEAAAVQTGTITGTITGDDGRGPLANVEVVISGRPPILTNVSGVYTDNAVPAPGSRTITVTSATLPAFCQPPQATGTLTPANGQSVFLNASATVTQNYAVDCAPVPPQVGTVNGTITRTGTGSQSLAGISFSIDPDAAGPPTVNGTVSGSGATVTYSAQVQVGTGTGAGSGSVTVGNIPSGCTAPAAGTYSGLTDGGTQTVDFSIQCDAPPARYVFRNSWGPISGGTVALTISFDPSGFNDPLINGAGPDGFAGMGALITLTGTAAGRLTSVTGAGVAPFSQNSINPLLPNIAFVASTTAGDQFALSSVEVLTFTIGAGPPGTVTTLTGTDPGNLEISATNADVFSLVFSGPGQNIDIIEATLNLP